MKILTALAAAAFVVAVALPASAGGAGEKCTYDTQACLNKLSTKKTSGWLGVEYDKSTEGVVKVKNVIAGSPAEAAGFKTGDIVLAVNGAKYSDKEAVKKATGDWTVGQKLTYTVQRDGKDVTVPATLGSMPENVYASMVGSHMISNHVSAQTAVTTETPAPTK
ncbi:MAG: PDZ domain-containing protein [Candidatus Eiseniibacteriota bacterium]